MAVLSKPPRGCRYDFSGFTKDGAMHVPSAFCVVDPALREVAVAYKDVPLPSRAEVGAVLDDLPSLRERASVAPVDVTHVVDLSMRFACLAYRRNCQNARNVLLLRDVADGAGGLPYGVELQFRGSLGAHAVVYLMCLRPGQLSAVLSFKGSTLSSPGAPLLSDWVHNLRFMLPWHSKSVEVGAQLAEGSEAHVHPGWHEYLHELLESFRLYRLAALPQGLASAWGLPDGINLWGLLCSEHCERVLVVGHSLGGALASMTATLMGSSISKQIARPPDAREIALDEEEDALNLPPRVEAELAEEGVPAPSPLPSPLEWEVLGVAGDESAVLPEGEAVARDGRDDAAALATDIGARGPSSWRERARREDGPDGYQFGDLTRSLLELTKKGRTPGERSANDEGAGSSRSGFEAAAGGGRRLPMLVTFGCPIVGDSGFVQSQNRHVDFCGGLRVFNEKDPVPSTGFGGMSFAAARVGRASKHHGGVPIALNNDALTAANPYSNHLRYCLTSYELCRTLCRDQPALRVRYVLPGLHYIPDENNTHIAPSPTISITTN